MLDIGCGEGYYLNQLHDAAINDSANLQLLGLDISKAGVRLAAKRKLGAQLVVDSAYKIPLFADSVDAVLSIFSPSALTRPLESLKLMAFSLW